MGRGRTLKHALRSKIAPAPGMRWAAAPREAKATVVVEWPDGSKDTWKTHRYGVLLRALAQVPVTSVHLKRAFDPEPVDVTGQSFS